MAAAAFNSAAVAVEFDAVGVDVEANVNAADVELMFVAFRQCIIAAATCCNLLRCLLPLLLVLQFLVVAVAVNKNAIDCCCS